jgi:alanine racemase
MSLTLYVDGDRFRTHLRTTLARHPDLVPVAKGNGYGLGLPRLAQLSTWLGVDTLAVGTYDELPKVAHAFPGSLLVLTPWRPFSTPVPDDVAGRVIHTVSRVEDLSGLLAAQPEARIVVERTTSMLRHGLSARGLREAAAMLAEHRGGVRLEGVALHLPMAGASHLSEVRRLMNDVVASALDTRRIWVSHLTVGEMATLDGDWPEFTFRPRVGTGLWLGDRGALSVRATVLDVHPVERGDIFGYRGRSAPKTGTILIVGGGTAHGIGLEAPTGGSSLKDRAATLARGSLDAAGFVRSPYSIGGKQRLFAEPPHMQASMLFVPHGAPVPAVGDEVDVRVRYTATTFDRIDLD